MIKLLSLQVLGISIFLTGICWERGIARTGIGLMVGAIPFSFLHFLEYIKNNQAAKIGLIWMLFCLGYGLIQWNQFDEQLKSALRSSYLGGYFLIGFYFSKHRKLKEIFSLILLGFLFGRVLHVKEIIEAGETWWQHRYALGFNSPGGLGLYSAAALWGVFCFFTRMKPWVSFSLCLLFSECLLLSQSRSAWLAIAPLLIVALFRQKRKLWFILAVTALLLLVISQGAIISSRVTDESTTYQALIEGKIPYPLQAPGQEKSVAIRIWMYLHGLQLWMERPLLGWGPGSTPKLIKETFPPGFPRFNDLHSVPVELLVRFGIVGFTLYWSMIFSVILAGYRSYKQGTIPKDVFFFSLGALWIYFVFGIFGFRLLNDDWRYYWFITAALLTSLERRY